MVLTKGRLASSSAYSSHPASRRSPHCSAAGSATKIPAGFYGAAISAAQRTVAVDCCALCHKKRLFHYEVGGDLTKLPSYCIALTDIGEAKALFKTFIIGLLLGVLAMAGALYAFPVVDQQRENSVASVATNGGNVESFFINFPADRILVRQPGQDSLLPDMLEWPGADILQPIGVELYKIRNERGVVVGVASQNSEAGSTVTDWLLHLPARGSQLISVQTQTMPNGVRRGDLRAGSREFAKRRGSVVVRWVPDDSTDQRVASGRIEMLTNYVGQVDQQ